MIPKISVIMPVYNSENFLKYSIESILNQTFKNFEFFIINDGSTDKSIKIINSYKDKRIKLINQKKNKGVAFCMNFGIKIALGEYIARMDADDISVSSRLKIQFDFLEKNKNIDVCGSWAEVLSKKIIWRYPVSDNDIRANLFFNSSIINSSFMARKSKLSEYKISYDNDFIHAEDFEFWTRAYNNLTFYNIPKVLLKYRINDSSLRRKENEIYKHYLVKIYSRNFNKIGLKLTIRERIIIDFLINNKLKIKRNDIIIIKNLLLKIIKNNKKFMMYPEREFNDSAGYYWHLLMRNNLNPLNLKCFFSKLLIYSFRSVIKRIAVKMFYLYI